MNWILLQTIQMICVNTITLWFQVNAMTIIEHKKEIRKRMLRERGSLDATAKSAYDRWICEALERIIRNRGYKVIHSYIPLSAEIDIRPLLYVLLDMECTVVCPKTLPKRKLENRILRSMDALETGIMGTQHPSEAHVYEGPFDLIIVPGLAYDSARYRVGYGGGYYDNFIISQPSAATIGIFYPQQQIEKVPLEPHDMQLNEILVKKSFSSDENTTP